MLQIEIYNVFVRFRPDAMVDHENAHGSTVLLARFFDEVVGGLFVADVCLESNDVRDVGQFADSGVVMCSHSCAQLDECLDCL